MGLDNGAIATHFYNNARDVAAAVQSGLIEWSEGHQGKEPTWKVLLDAMESAQIPKQYIKGLKKELGLR